jgi:hypothetical protein
MKTRPWASVRVDCGRGAWIAPIVAIRGLLIHTSYRASFGRHV